MKDFYKILGVKENASEEEIRERWIELTKHYHPDRGIDIASEEKIREINEAYQVLKHSSTRVEYDLSRAYGPQKRKSKREFYFKKLGVPASILIMVIIIGVVYIRNYQLPPPFGPIVSDKIDSDAKTQRLKDPIDLTTQRPKDAIDPSNQIDATPQPTQQPRDSTTQRPNDAMDAKTQQRIDVPAKQPKVAAATPVVPIVLNQRNKKDQRNQIGSLTQRPKEVMSPITPSVAMAATMEKVQLPQPSQNPITPLSNDSIANKPTDAINPINTSNTINPIDPKIELAQFKPPSLLATEDEVKKFFKDYIERYDRMDIEGFLSLFSPKAVQNQKDRLEGIQKIYIDFFNQGEKVRYRMQDMKIEIYQNVAEVKARYEIVQTMKTGRWERVWRGNVRWVLDKENGTLKILSLDYQHQ